MSGGAVPRKVWKCFSVLSGLTTSSEDMLETQIWGPHPRPTDENLHFPKTPGASKLHLKCEKHWPVGPLPGLPQVVSIVRICT